MGDKNFNIRSNNNPRMTVLNVLVQKVIKSSTWWEMYGKDGSILIAAFVSLPLSFYLLASHSFLFLAFGFILFGISYAILAQKGGHSASHLATAHSIKWNNFWKKFFIEFIGAFSVDAGCETHVKMHHMHTNVIGLGDSSIWKMPFVPWYIYMFLTPLILPLITPLVAVGYLWGQWRKLLRSLPLMIAGLAANFLILHLYCRYTLFTAFLCMFLSRAVMTIPYIHVNIFQHIGLPMYHPDNRPSRIYLMSSGVLNLDSHPLLDLTFGHSLISCHVEHHLFPQLSDNMCLKIKPVVSNYLKQNSLPYNERSYSERLNYFLKNYNSLMVESPPITKFAGIQ